MTLFIRQAKVNLQTRMPTAQDSTAFSKGIIQAPRQWDETQEALSKSRRVNEPTGRLPGRDSLE
jgi:hypothetical protein